MKQPYFYIIQHIKSGLYYAGVRYAVGCNSNELMKVGGYLTSSTYVANMIKNDGLDAFIIRKIRHFNSPSEALQYETKFLNKVNARFNKSFINLSNSDGGIFLEPENYKNIMITKYGVEYPMQSDKFKNKIKNTCIKKYGTEFAAQSPVVKEKTKNTCIKKYGVNAWFNSNEFKEKRNTTMLKKYGVTSSTQKHKEAMKATSGENHHRFSGYYVTPTGKFASAYLAAAGTPETTRKNIARFCMNPDVKISKGQYVKVAYLQNNYDLTIIGKTFRELGFWFEPLEMH